MSPTRAASPETRAAADECGAAVGMVPHPCPFFLVKCGYMGGLISATCKAPLDQLDWFPGSCSLFGFQRPPLAATWLLHMPGSISRSAAAGMGPLTPHDKPAPLTECGCRLIAMRLVHKPRLIAPLRSPMSQLGGWLQLPYVVNTVILLVVNCTDGAHSESCNCPVPPMYLLVASAAHLLGVGQPRK